MFYHNINPVLLRLGPLSVRYYGLIYALGFILVFYILRKTAIEKRIKNFNVEKSEELALWLILSVIMGARLTTVLIFNPGYYFSDPVEILKIWHGGLSFLGGFVSALIVGNWYCRKNNMNFGKLADIVIIPVSLILGLGRIANFINAELYGIKTSVKWCVVFPNVSGCRHPTQLYEAFAYILIFFIIFFLYKKYLGDYKEKKIIPGTTLWVFGLLYGIFRFIICFWKEQAVFYGLRQGQWFLLVLIIFSVVWLVRNYMIKNKPL